MRFHLESLKNFLLIDNKKSRNISEMDRFAFKETLHKMLVIMLTVHVTICFAGTRSCWFRFFHIALNHGMEHEIICVVTMDF